jgi:hypothetical protein
MAELLEVEHVLKHRSKHPANPAEGDLLVYHHFERMGEGQTHHLYPVVNPIEAIAWIDKLADEQVNDEDIGWNAFGLQVFEDDEWVDWYNDEGQDIDEYKEELNG